MIKIGNFQGILLVLVLSFSLISAEIYFEKGPRVKLTKSATLSGKVELSRDGRPFTSFTGIPYGIVQQRFQASLPYPEWEGIRTATDKGPSCIQAEIGHEEVNTGAEDCLNLNVHVPMAKAGKKLPVMVWIHGGGFQYGDGFGYQGKYFMDEDIILVTINYRLGVFGFLSTGDSVVPGNNGLKDQVLALRWVQKNIEKFGGDPGKVTIFGESAGAASVHYLLLSPSSNGLFHQAISQSNSAASVICSHPNPREEAVLLAKHLKCPSTSSEITSEEIVKCLRETSVTKLVSAQYSYRQSFPLNFFSFFSVPSSEPEGTPNAFLTESPLTILQNKEKPLKNIPWMVGVTEDEGCTMYAGLVLNHEELTEELNNNWESLAPSALDYDKFISCPDKEKKLTEKIRKFYFGDKRIGLETRNNLTDLYSDSLITYGVYRSAIQTASRGQDNVYLYQYAYPGPQSVFGVFYEMTEEEAKKVGHGDELQHQFNLEWMDQKETSEHELFFSKNFIKLWASFATHGEPRHLWGSNSPKEWKPIPIEQAEGKEPLEWFRIDRNPTYVQDPYKERMELWDEIYDQFILNENASKQKVEL